MLFRNYFCTLFLFNIYPRFNSTEKIRHSKKKIHPPPLFDESEQVVKNPIKRRFSCNGSLMRKITIN